MSSGFNGIIIVASNPVDLMAYVVYKVSGLPKNKVIGSGTVLDTARLRYMLADYFKVSSKNVHAYIMGEHGDSSFVSWDNAYIGSKKLTDIMKDNNYPISDLNDIHKNVVNAAYEIIQRKKATYYGIGVALVKIIKAILNDENEIMTLSTYQSGEYGQKGLYIGVPAILGSSGIRGILELNLSDEDQAKFDNSCKIINDTIEKIQDLL
jgi:L-lactate dehydrogenase